MSTFQAEAGNASLSLWPASPSYGWLSLRPLVPRNCSHATADQPSCVGVGHDLHYYMPKLEMCRAMAKTVSQKHQRHHGGGDGKATVDFADSDVNLVGEDGWG